MTLIGAKNIFLATVQNETLLDDALISLFAPIHETFRVFCDAEEEKNVKISQVSRKAK